MKKLSTNGASFEDRVTGISTAVLVLMSQELQTFIDCGRISSDDFQFVLRWFKDWNFDVPFVLAKHNFFESGVDYKNAVDMVDCMVDDDEEVSDNQKQFIVHCLLCELQDRISSAEENLTSSFDIAIAIGEGRVVIN